MEGGVAQLLALLTVADNRVREVESLVEASYQAMNKRLDSALEWLEGLARRTAQTDRTVIATRDAVDHLAKQDPAAAWNRFWGEYCETLTRQREILEGLAGRFLDDSNRGFVLIRNAYPTTQRQDSPCEGPVDGSA